MKCPQCGAPTEVSEKRGPFRDRRCTSTGCGLTFTTREQVVRPRKQEVRPGEHGRLCARTRATQIEAPVGLPVVKAVVSAAPFPISLAQLEKSAIGCKQMSPREREVGA
jgi:hypothetical protein